MKKLREVSQIISGYYFRSSMAGFSDGDVKLVQPSDLDDFNADELTSIDAPIIKLEKGDILLSNRGKLRAMVMPIGGDFVFPSSIYAIRLNSKKYIPEFVSTYLNSEAGQAQLLAMSSGSYISNLTKTALEDIELPDVSIDRQTKIAEIDVNLSKYRIAIAQKTILIDSIKNNLIKELK